MSEARAIVDTCFFDKLSQNGKRVEDLKTVLGLLEYKPVVHPYIAEYELDVFPYFHKLVQEGYIEIVDYSEFLPDEIDKSIYEKQFIDLHNKIREYINAKGGLKNIPELALSEGFTIFNTRKSGASLGDVHIILMAKYMSIPIILTEDNDVALLRMIAANNIDSSYFKLEIYSATDLINIIAGMKEPGIDKKNLEKINDNIGERRNRKHIREVWKETKA